MGAFLARLFYADTLIIISVDFYILTFTIHGINIAEIVSQCIDNVKESKACFRLVGTIVFRNHFCFTAFVVTFIYYISFDFFIDQYVILFTFCSMLLYHSIQ